MRRTSNATPIEIIVHLKENQFSYTVDNFSEVPASGDIFDVDYVEDLKLDVDDFEEESLNVVVTKRVLSKDLVQLFTVETDNEFEPIK